MATSIGQCAPIFLPGEPPLWQRSLAGHSLQGCKELNTTEVTLREEIQDFNLWQLRPRESWVWRWRSCLACGDPGGAKRAGTRTASTTGIVALSVLFRASCRCDLKASLASLSPSSAYSGTWRAPLPGGLFCCSAHQAHRRAPWLGASSIDQHVRHLKGQPGWGPTL